MPDVHDAVVRQYRPLVWKIAGRYHADGHEPADIAQEGFVGLLAACDQYRPDRGASFQTFAGLCIERRIQTFVRAARTARDRALTDAARVTDHDGIELPALELITDTRADVPALVEHRDTLRAYAAVIRDRLTDTEREAIRLIVNGAPYARSKRLDNAAQKARRKLKEAA